MVELKAEDRQWVAFEARAAKDNLRPEAPSCCNLSFDLDIFKSSRALALMAGLAAAVLLCGCSGAPAPAALAATAKPGTRPPADCHRAETQRFSLHSDPWINLHHFLYEWARNASERQPGDRRRAVDVIERARIAELDGRERQAWERALALYRERWIARDLVDDEELVDLRDALAEIACAAGGPDRIPAGTREALTDAMPVYRRHWWRGHHASNQQRIDEIVAGLKEHERVVTERMAEAYGGRWSPERIRVDLSAYVSWSGAYTTNDPDHITITSTTSPHITGLNALEMLFHEASHSTFLEEPFLAELEATFRAHGAEVPDGLDHVLQFVTAAELLRSRLGGEELRSFQPYAVRSGMYERNRTRAEQRVLVEKHWLPFLAGQITRKEALNRIATELARQQAAVWHKGVIAA